MTGGTFYDANVLLEIVLNRDRRGTAEKAVRAASDRRCISALTAHLVVHFGRPDLPLAVLEGFLADFTVLPLTSSDFAAAFADPHAATDYEDALQIATATAAGCSEFLTFDRRLVKRYGRLPGLPVRKPAS